MIYSAAIPCFLESAREQNISRAAKKLYISPQAVSKHILRLEQELDCPLFLRMNNQLTLTPEGRLYYACFTDMLKKLEETKKAIEAMPKADTVIRIGCIKGLSIEKQISELMAAASTLPPSIHLLWERDEPYSLCRRMLENDFDIVFSYNKDLEQPNIESVPFLTSEFCLIAGKNLAGLEDVKNIKDFNRFPFMTWTLDGTTESHSRKGFQRLCEACDFAPASIFVLPNMESLYTGVEMGNGVTLASRHDRLCYSELVKVFPLGIDCDLSAAWRKDETRYDVRVLIEGIKNSLIN